MNQTPLTWPEYKEGIVRRSRQAAPAAVIDQDSASKPGETFTVVFRGTLAACEAWVAEREKIEPENVHRGRYGIDADFGESVELMPRPHCAFCESNHGVTAPARFVAAQSEDQGETIKWVLICTDHADGWNDGGDWNAPMYEIGPSRNL